MRYRNLGLFLALATLWGSAFVAIKAGLDLGFPPVLFAAVRYDIAGVIMLAYAAWVVDDPIPRTRAQWAAVVVGAVFLIAGYHALLFVGEVNTTSAVAAVIVSLSPVLTTAIARGLLPSESLDATGVLGLLLGLVGVAILLDPDPTQLLAADTVAKLLVFGAALSFALGSVLARRLDADIAIEPMEGWSMVLGALLMHAVSFGLGESPDALVAALTGPQAPVAIGALAYLVLGASAVGFLIYFDLLDRLGPVGINLVSYVAPVVAAAVGVVLLAEPVRPLMAVGFTVIVTGFLLVKRDAVGRELRAVTGGRQPTSDD